MQHSLAYTPLSYRPGFSFKVRVLISESNWDILGLFQSCRSSNHEILPEKIQSFKPNVWKYRWKLSLRVFAFWGRKKSNKCWPPKLIFPSNCVANKYGVKGKIFFFVIRLLGFCTSFPAAFHRCPTLPHLSVFCCFSERATEFSTATVWKRWRAQ